MSRVHTRRNKPAEIVEIVEIETPTPTTEETEMATPEPTKTRSNLAATISRYRPGYKPMAVEGKRKTQNNGDAIAVALLGVSLDKLKAFSALRFDGKRYDHLNDGHARMCIGNNIRQFWKQDASILDDVLALR